MPVQVSAVFVKVKKPKVKAKKKAKLVVFRVLDSDNDREDSEQRLFLNRADAKVMQKELLKSENTIWSNRTDGVYIQKITVR